MEILLIGIATTGILIAWCLIGIFGLDVQVGYFFAELIKRFTGSNY